jgi:hypothetical protein
MRRIISLFLLFAAMFFCSAVGAAAKNQSEQTESVPPFVFHSGFWINLHHFLYEQAAERIRRGSSSSAAGADKSIAQLPPEQLKVWSAALDYYATAIIKHDLMDEDMTKVNDILSQQLADSNLSKSGLNDDLRKILESVAPIYRARWWPAHDRANRFWVAVATPLVKQFGATLVKQLASAYRAQWPAKPIRVDVVEYANWAGGYTTTDRERNVHTTICSIEKDYQDFSALERCYFMKRRIRWSIPTTARWPKQLPANAKLRTREFRAACGMRSFFTRRANSRNEI